MSETAERAVTVRLESPEATHRLGVRLGELLEPGDFVGRIPLYHADLYRLENVDDLYATGFMDLVDTQSAVLVEWLDRIPQAAPREYLRVTLKHAGETARELTAEAFGPRPRALLDAWLDARS